MEDVGELTEGTDVGVSEGGQGGVDIRVLQSSGDVGGGSADGGHGAGSGHAIVRRVPGECVDAGSHMACLPDPAAVATVGVEVGSQIPGIEAVRVPGLAVGRFFVDNNMRSRWGDGVGIEVVLAEDLSPG